MNRRIVFYFGFIFLSFLSLDSVSNNFPDKLSYQLVIRKDDKLLREATVSIRISIYSLNGKIENVVYSEAHFNLKTDKNGLASLKIGEGIRAKGFSDLSLSSLEWSKNSYYIKSEIDLSGKNNYDKALVNKSEMLSVPYAFYAADAPKAIVINNLESNSIAIPLSANQGRILKEMIEKKDKGDTGPAGPAGPRGSRGATGLPGAAGAKGETGAAGPRGEAGPKGNDGERGPIGETGPPGPTGPEGKRGPAGKNGVDGKDGAPGAAGPAGKEGPAGATGEQGVAGPQGPPGPEKIIDNLDSDETTSALSAKQGKVLAEMIKSKSPFIKTDTGENIITFSDEEEKSKSSGTKNMLLGIGSKSSSESPSNEIAIGSDAQGKGSNTVVLGNDITKITYLKGQVVLEGYITESKNGTYFDSKTTSKATFFVEKSRALDGTSSAISHDISLYAKHSIATEKKFLATSDKRVKSIKGISDKREDLKKLLNIEITDYTMIDSIESGVKPFKKVIAQQIENIVPEVIDINKGIIPNVYELAKSVKVSIEGSAITTNKAHDFSIGDIVKIIIENEGTKEVKVKAVIGPNTFLIEEVLDSNKKVFIYGKKVDDMRSVDYDGLTTLNISATQAVYEELISTKKKLSDNKKELSVTKEKLSSTQKKLDTLIKALSKSNALSKEDIKVLIK
ncbi:collagen-like domain-containing protein [Ichthyobacterium seriolicida]|uniref:Peptidase S74 domain-containing protein n=1 Tax=Ichthyobacterium seriolicida TaxID=242600 RepID=A0A1J1E7I2_9FLAO|nr:hypothetical protein [Ichthyobacterium seriolicida]BAV95286.1 hypothetical protein JBKA6_1273 [Ichthyobacterium seriolicida]